MSKDDIIINGENELSSPSLASIDSELYKGFPVKKVHSDGSFANSTFTIHRSNFWILVRADTETITGFIKEQYKKMNGLSLTRFVDIAHITHVFSGFVGTSRLENWSRKLDDDERDEEAKKTVTIIHSDFQTLDLIAETAKDAKIIYRALQTLCNAYREIKYHSKKEDLLTRYLWRDADRNCDDHIEWKEIEIIFQRLNIYDANAKSLFFKQGGRVKKLTYAEFSKFLQSFHSSVIPNGIWDRAFTSNLDTVSKRDFLERFLHKMQGEHDATMDTVNKIFQFLNIQADTMNRSQFHIYLHSNANLLFRNFLPSEQQLDDSKPLSSYWINTSHNTYCTGNQLTSQSSVQMYLYALCKGCKSLEIDCWDGKSNERYFGDYHPKPIPVVYHGHTLTSQIPFADVIRCIRGWMLENPDTFPIILSLENHCSPPCQLEMAVILRETLGKLLYVPELYDFSADSLPSPSDLRGKVIIKGKLPSLSEIDDDDDTDLEHNQDQSAQEQAKLAKVSDVPALVKLTLLRGTKFKSFEESETLHPTSMHSLSEPKVTKLLKESKANLSLFRILNASHLTRVYPKGIRVDSSNLNPMSSWAAGCQMAALNIQAHDSAVIMNNGLFRSNGGCGYVPKPYWLLRDDEGDLRTRSKPLTVGIKVLSGMCLPKPWGEKTGEIIDSYVVLCMHDVDVDSRSKNDDFKQSTYHSTRMIRDNGFSPVWNEGQFTEFHVMSPDLAILDFKVMDQNLRRDEEVCFSAIPVSALRSGIRCVDLFDQHNSRWGPFDFATLLVEIVVKYD